MRERVFLKDPEILEITKKLIREETYYIAGHNSIFVPSLNTAYVDIDVCRHWPNLEGEAELMTPQDAARTELNREFKGKIPKWLSRKNDIVLLDLTPPQYWNGRNMRGDMVYFDLKSAYWQIYRQLWIDVKWPRGIGQFPLWRPAARLETWKAARNSVIGIARSKEVLTVKGYKVQWVKYHNPFFAPQLWHTVQMFLHELAEIALKLGCVYVNTDGYIFRVGKGADYFSKYLEDYKLVYRVGAGKGEIAGWNSYSIEGFKTTIPYRNGQRGGEVINNLAPGACEPTTLDWWLRYCYGVMEDAL